MTATDDEGSVSDTDARRPYTAPEHGRPIDRIPVTTAVRIDSISNSNDSSPDTCMLTDSTRTSPSGLRSTPIGQPQRSVPDFTRMLQHAHKRSLPTQPVTSAPAGWVGGLWPSSRTIESPTRDHDWQSFLDAYSQGFWDPRHTPMQPPTSVPSFPFPDMATDGGASTSHSPDRYLTADAAAAVPSSALPAAATEVKRYSSPGSGPTTLSDNSWAAFSDSTAPSSTGSNQPAPPRPVGQVPDKASPSSLAERRGNATPDLSQSLPTKMPLISQLSTGSTTPYTPYPSGRPRLKASSSSPGISLDAEPDMSFEASEAISQRAATAATMRWAGVGVAIAPLALPSPEHELTDPFRHYNKSLPPPTPGEQRDANHNRKRSSSSASAVSVAAIRLRDRGFWEGTQEVSPDMLPPIPGSLQATPGPKVPPAVSSRPSSPILSRKDSRTSLSSRGKQRDYFSLKAPPPPRNPSGMDSDSAQEDGSSRSGRSSPTSVYVTPTAWETPGLVVGSSRPTAGLRPLAKLSGMTTAVPTFKLPTLPTIPSQEAVPTLERTDSIATSATVSSATAQPSHTPQDEDEPSPSLRPDSRKPTPSLPRPTIGARALTQAASVPTFGHPIESPASIAATIEASNLPIRDALAELAALSAKPNAAGITTDEALFLERGFFAPPMPPNETARLRALYKHNIMFTGADMNFERLTHLVKLVFNCKMVMISLIDTEVQWFKSESGLGLPSTPRNVSFCSHTILQRDEEPLVVLNSKQDWRFCNNPLVTDGPHIQFYAGSALRTSEGFNIGSLCICDDQPRTEFTPRQRHILKEFAGVVMREVELWKDKIQLRIRDRIQTSMEKFTRECLEIDLQSEQDPKTSLRSKNMDKIYDRAVKLIKRTLDVEGVVVMDVSHADVGGGVPPADGGVSLVMHSAKLNGDVVMANKALSGAEYNRLSEFFHRHPDGKIVEGFVPSAFRGLIPSNIKYALSEFRHVVPVFDVDRRPFALLGAYNSTHGEKPFLEGHELSYLRAIGVIILSAVLKRRMMLADKAKSLFISNISHELRTPLHGILAAAELLQDTILDQHQASILQTVQACGTSLVETVNHVLDFTKLSGNTKSGGVENAIEPTRVDLMQLVEEAVEGCWIGYRARASALGESDIGSVYSPPTLSPRETKARSGQHVETVVDVDLRTEGWNVKCEKGGIRRVLMNLIGNSLKFTTDGSVHIVLRQLHGASTARGKIRIELAVLDSGKGISKEFLKNQLFHPFSQENPLQTGTGLGLAIVNSIIRSKSVDGSVDVWSVEGAGTEIRVTLDVEVASSSSSAAEAQPWARDGDGKPFSVSFVGFNHTLKGEALLDSVIHKYFEQWWGFNTLPDEDAGGDILVVNEDHRVIQRLLDDKVLSQPIIVFSSFRGDSSLVNTVNAFENAGGFCRIVYKPGGPSRLRNILRVCVDWLMSAAKRADDHHWLPEYPNASSGSVNLMRRRSDEVAQSLPRPHFDTRSSTYPSLPPTLSTISAALEVIDSPNGIRTQAYPIYPASAVQLKKSPDRRPGDIIRVLIVEDNQILRDLLVRWATTKGYDHREAFDGLQGVEQFEKNPVGTFDVILLDVSMPNLDGISATRQIREIEAARQAATVGSSTEQNAATIVALTGMSSVEDRSRAFDAGVNSYLVKPVSFKQLDKTLRELREAPQAR